MRNDKIEATKKLLELQGDNPEEIDAIVKIMNADNQAKGWQEIRSWVGTITGIIALIVSILVAIFK